MILLEKYIKEFLKEATSSIIHAPSEFKASTQSYYAASYEKDMTDLSKEDTLLTILRNIGTNCFISFVDKYDENVPRLEVSPVISYNTPHGNYGYPLTVNNFKTLFEEGLISNTNFAMDRPYFHLYKASSTANILNINADNTTNYKGNIIKDLKTIVHTATVFALSKAEEESLFKMKIDNPQIAEKLKGQAFETIRANESKDLSEGFDSMIMMLTNICRATNGVVPSQTLNLVVNYITKKVIEESKTSLNTFYNRNPRKKINFHTLYYACWRLSGMISSKDSDGKERSGSIFTMLLNSIDIDFIHDKGSKTLHSAEPTQAVYLNSSKKENVFLIGTFKNIFKEKNNITAESIIALIEKHPELGSLYGTSLFDDVKLADEDYTLRVRREAYKLIKNNYSLEKSLEELSSDHFINISIEKGKDEMILAKISLDSNFLSLNAEDKVRKIKNADLMLAASHDLKNNLLDIAKSASHSNIKIVDMHKDNDDNVFKDTIRQLSDYMKQLDTGNKNLRKCNYMINAYQNIYNMSTLIKSI